MGRARNAIGWSDGEVVGLGDGCGSDPGLTKWSVRLDPAIVLTGKGYKEHHWLVVPPINHFGYFHIFSTTAYFYYADVRSNHSRNSGRVRQGPRRCSCPGSDRQSYQRREGYYSLYVQRRGLPCEFLLRVHRYTCAELGL